DVLLLEVTGRPGQHLPDGPGLSHGRLPTRASAGTSALPRLARLLLLEELGLEVGAAGRNELVEITGHHRIQVVPGEADAVIGQAVLGEVVGAHLLAAVAASHLPAAHRIALALLLLLLELEEPRAEHPHGLGAVLGLALLLLPVHDDAAGLVDETHRGVGGVHALSARAGGAHDLQLDV